MNELVLSGGQKILFWFYKTFSKRLLKKYFPLNESDLQITIENMPGIYIDEQINHCIIHFAINIKNYTNYDLFISFVQIDLNINSYRFLNTDKIMFRNLKKKEGSQLYLEIPLNYYQVKKIQSMISVGSNVLYANFNLRILTKNIFGDISFNRFLNGSFEVKNILQ